MLPTDSMLKDNLFAGKTIVITGGGTGLGKSIATRLSQLRANVVIASRKLDVLKTTASEIHNQTGGEILPVPCDVRNLTEVENLYEQSVARFGKVDALVNNAAGNFVSPTERLSAKAFSTVIDIVLMGSINCSLTFGKKWIAAQQKGTILSLVTTYATTGSAFVVPSACAKAGVQALTRSLAVEWGKYNIRFNGIAPGPFPTKGAMDRLLPEALREKLDISQNNPLKRTGKHEEIADLAAYLLSDYAAFINGEIVTIDGGEWLQGAGQFNFLEQVSPEMWDALLAVTKKRND